MTDQQAQQVPIVDAMRAAVGHHQAGHLEQAELIYRSILDAEPAHAGALCNLGLIALQTGRAQQAAPLLRAARDADPGRAELWANHAVALAGSGDPGAAREVLLQARSRGLGGPALEATLARVERMLHRPGEAPRSDDRARIDEEAETIDALVRLFSAARHEEVERTAAEAVRRFPDSPRVLGVLGASRLARGANRDALHSLSRAHELAPSDAWILNLLGVAHERTGDDERAGRCFERSLALSRDEYDTLINASAWATRRGDHEGGARLAERALALRPDGGEALFNFGNALAARGDHAAAAALYRRAISLGAGNVAPHVSLGKILADDGNAGEAVEVLRQALALNAADPAVHLNLARALHALGETVSARTHFRAASDMAPDLGEAHSAYLCSLAHDETISAEQAYAEHVRIGDLMEAPHRAAWRAHDNDRDPERELRVGFVSGDLRNHPVANLIEPIWRSLRGRPLRIVAYSNCATVDEVSVRLRALTDEWVQIERLGDDALAERIRADRIDILFDLSGHTALNRLPVFARKPAPIQASCIGYPGTTGLAAMDYRVVRGLDSKAGAIDSLFREKLVRFRLRGFQPDPDAPDVNALPALAAGHVTFGSFNRVSKIGDSVIALWSRVLLAIPGSRLLIAAIPEAQVQDRLRASFASHGIAPERLDFRPRVSMREYLAMHHEVDIALDTFPYSGGTTNHHALWMGVPVVTLSGPGLQHNQGSSILGMLGLSDWATATASDYMARAVSAASDLTALSELRHGLRARITRAYLNSNDELGRELGGVLRMIWRRWCAGLQPASIEL